MISWRYQA